MDTVFSRDGALARIRLNRPRVLNALAPWQFGAIHEQLRVWDADSSVGAVMIEGTGKAFCAGGDIKAVWEARQRGDHVANRTLFRAEYRLDRLIHRFNKPYVALLDGLVMGGGAGLSLNGRYQVASERTVFAMPEAAIGFFPDVGASHFLSRAPGHLGLYLGLTGMRLTAADMVWAGLASHHVPTARHDDLRAALAVAAAAIADPDAAIAEVLGRFHVSTWPAPYAERQETIEQCFGKTSVAEIMACLAERQEPWLVEARERMAATSPTSLAVIWRQLTEGQGMTFETAIAREYRMACAFLAGDQFAEGIRAAVVDKDRSPQWCPDRLEQIASHDVDRFFHPVEDELTFEEGI